ncbi:conserved hypothetical protein [Methylocella silvestris BL2]|uniref:DUF2157 domain-containing protein n=1 Tax=Methylocella silvestris (strain DSM 15510 / CIP 108128 / LMG 27833 / NCIMB 13906 / BL2) TaxID=395965 RepID=B8EKB8_METSB|nr:conserved hypothetical protein [Methylocella silvestris BL2]
MFTEDDLSAARAAGVLSEDDYQRLNAFLLGRAQKMQPQGQERLEGLAAAPEPARFDVIHLLWYAGALVIIAAMAVFINQAFNALGGPGLALVAVCYAAFFVFLGDHLWRRRDLKIPGGLAITIAVAMTPMAIWGLQESFGLWSEDAIGRHAYSDFVPLINGNWLFMELAAVAATLLALRFFPFAFLTMIAAIALWFMSMDLGALLTHGRYDDYELRREVSLWFGLALIGLAWFVDVKWRRAGDFAFWLHLAAAAAFWGGLTFRASSGEWLALTYCLINIALVFLAVFLRRRVYAVFGAIGVSVYLGHLAYDVFDHVVLFSFALSAVGLAIIGLGIALNRKIGAIDSWIDANAPPALQRLRPPA